METGQQIRLAGQGEAGFNGGPYGDLYVVVSVEASDKFEREERLSSTISTSILFKQLLVTQLISQLFMVMLNWLSQRELRLERNSAYVARELLASWWCSW